MPPSRLGQASIELLSNPKFTSVGPELENEVVQLKTSAQSLQKMLSTGSKLQWSAVDKARLEGLVKRLKNYNESLNRILPIQVGSDLAMQNGLFTPLNPQSSESES
jgi:hypothetical protein